MKKNIDKNISVSVTINAPIGKVWKLWTLPKHIVKWNNASNDWHTASAENDLNVNGRFKYRMESKDGSLGFDFQGTYTALDENKLIQYTLDDGREVQVFFESDGHETLITEIFEAEEIHPRELQYDGWQAILNNFKRYTEEN